MKVQAVNFCGDISKGKKEFENLPLAKQVVLKSVEKYRQDFNAKNFSPIPAKDTDLAEYVRHAVFVEELVKKRAKDIFANLRKNMGI